MNILKISSICLLAASLSACFNSDEPMNRLTTLGNVAADGDPVQIVDPVGLKQDIANLFGHPDDEPLAVEDGDTFQSIIDRGGRG